MDRKAAYLRTIAFSEGTDKPGQPTRNKGYDVIVGGALFTSYADHPRVVVPFPKLGIKSTAAGRYQILARYYDHYKAQLKLKDFGPEAQDAIAWQLIGECGAQGDVLAGNFEVAITKCRSRWASLPGAGYGQHEHKMSDLRKVYDDAIRS